MARRFVFSPQRALAELDSRDLVAVGLRHCIGVTVVVSLAACAGAAADLETNEDTDDGTLIRGVDQSALWQSKSVVYCFAEPRLAEMPRSVRAVVRTQADLSERWKRRKDEFIGAINGTWQAEGVLDLVPKVGCAAGQIPIRYNLDTPTGGYAGLGRIGGASGGIQMDAEFLGGSYQWGGGYHTFVAAHEMGHALGFRHEQDRRDSTCHVAQDFSGVGVTLTGYDASSLMNYCNNQATALSTLDKEGFKKAYAFLGGGTGGGTGGGSGGGGDSCSDSNSSCGYWASIGECTKNPGYMQVNCCGSCKGVSTCSDKHGTCAYWASIGECTKNPGYMQVNCCSSCRR